LLESRKQGNHNCRGLERKLQTDLATLLITIGYVIMLDSVTVAVFMADVVVVLDIAPLGTVIAETVIRALLDQARMVPAVPTGQVTRFVKERSLEAAAATSK
jgi:hypothetical protein